MSKITGEYWIIDGQVDFADGDIGDRNHEMIAIDSVLGQHSDAVRDLAEEVGLEGVEVDHYGEPDPEALSNALSAIHDRLTMGREDEEEPDPSALMSDEQAHAFMMEKIGCDEDAYAILQGGGDARYYAMEKWGWIAIRSNNVELCGYDASRQREIADAVKDILYEERGLEDDTYDPAEVELGVYDHNTGRSWNVTLADLENPEVQARPNQMPDTTYNKSIYHMSSPQDSEENKYSSPARSRPSPWSQAARDAGIIGPGQDLWRGTSEGVRSFRSWVAFREAAGGNPRLSRRRRQ